MFKLIDNAEFKPTGKRTLTVAGDMFIKADNDNMLIFASDIVDKSYIDTQSKGILQEINSKSAAKIEKDLDIKLSDYGVKILDECILMESDNAT